MGLPKRKQIRLPDYDYSTPGAYFVTICTQDRRCILSDIRRGDPCGRPSPDLTEYGIIVEQCLKQAESLYAVQIEPYVIMPNHIHFICRIDQVRATARPSTRKIVLSSLQERHGIGHAVSCFISSFSGINPIRSYSMWTLWRRLPLLLSGAPT